MAVPGEWTEAALLSSLQEMWMVWMYLLVISEEVVLVTYSLVDYWTDVLLVTCWLKKLQVVADYLALS